MQEASRAELAANAKTGCLTGTCRSKMLGCPQHRPLPMERVFVVAGSLLALVGVGMGAFAAHVLEAQVDARALATFEVAARYQIYHALALLALAWVHERWPSRLVRAAGWLFVAGTVVFSGSLYLLVLLGANALGAIAPLGGGALLAGWACLAIGVSKGANGS